MVCAVLAACAPRSVSSCEIQRDTRPRIKPEWRITLHLGEQAPEIGVLTIPCSAEQIALLPPRRRSRLWRKCEKELVRGGVDCLYAANELVDLEGAEALWNKFEMPDGRTLMHSMARDILRNVAKQRGLDLVSAEIGVWQSSFDETGYGILQSIADSLKFVTLFTEEPASAAPFAERLFLQTGLSANIVEHNSAMARCDIVLLLDSYFGPAAGDQTVLVDLSRTKPSGCLNTACFSLPPQFSALSAFWGAADQRAMEFLIRAHGNGVSGEAGLTKQIQAMGCRLQNVCYKPLKILDKAGGLVYNKP